MHRSGRRLTNYMMIVINTQAMMMVSFNSFCAGNRSLSNIGRSNTHGVLRLAAALARRNIHYGWVVVAVTFLTMLVTAGAMGAPGVLIVPLEREFGWDNAQISSALALRLLLFGLFGPFAAAFMNRFGLRRVMICAAILICRRPPALARDDARVATRVAVGLCRRLGTGLTAIVLAATVATRWFTAPRGLVVGLLSAAATGQLVFLPLIADLTDRFGWRMALIFVCGIWLSLRSWRSF